MLLKDIKLRSTTQSQQRRPGRRSVWLVQLEEAGAGAPDGRISHVALETDGEIQVFDVWESQEAFDAFGVTLLPILAAAGVEMNEPMVARVHNEIKG
jgi:hypothetical protein